MTEQHLPNSSEIPVNLLSTKESNDAEIRRYMATRMHPSSANKLHSSAMTSVSTLATMDETETEIDSTISASINPSSTSITDPISEDQIAETRRQMLELIRQSRHAIDTDEYGSDDDDDEDVLPCSLYSIPSSMAHSDIPLMVCPICLESAPLQSPPCCSFFCCNSCWRAHISATINDGRIQISCPANECDKYLTRETITTSIGSDSALHERYLKLYALSNQNPYSKTCPRCSHTYSLDIEIIDTKTQKTKNINKKLPKQVQCSACSLVWCFRCQAPWHENMTCKQFVKGDKLLAKWMNQKHEDQWNARKCPSCSSYIQRAGGCPHMTCRSCSCEFCYLCGRRYVKIPYIGQHSHRFSVFGCPYNLHPERPWLRRTIRGSIATGIVVASPVLLVGAATAAVVVLPSIGIYRLARHIRLHRRARHVPTITTPRPIPHFHEEHDGEPPLRNMYHGFDEDFLRNDLTRIIEQRLELLRRTPVVATNSNEDFPLSIFADMDVEHLFSDRDDDRLPKPPSDFRTCPTTPILTQSTPADRRVHFEMLEAHPHSTGDSNDV